MAFQSSSSLSRKDLIRKLLKGIETGDPEAATVVSEERYVQHNPQTREGGEGLAALFARISKSNPKVNIVRAFEDGDYVFGHTEYDFSTRRIGFEIFRFEGERAVEHWDNIQPRPVVEEEDDNNNSSQKKEKLNESGRSMVDGPTEAIDIDRTEQNRELIRDFIQTIFVDGRQDQDKIEQYLDVNLIQHNPNMKDGISGLLDYLQKVPTKYIKIHRVLAEGNFVLVASEGYRGRGISHDDDGDGDDGEIHTAFYDLYRVEGKNSGKLVEHWDTIEAVPPKSEWKNCNGKF